MADPQLRWWDSEVGYEVYIRSFADGNGDGVGDFIGLTEKLDYLAWLGAGIVWVTPFYPSPMRDFGYDVADYTDVDQLFGTLDDFDVCVAEAHRLGLRLIIDLVPNHSSDEHPWFQAAQADPEGAMRGYYHWRDPAVGGGPPNNWVSHFGGSAWTFHEASEQYYLHLFLPEQPDLNWSNPNLVLEFDEVLQFWLDRDVDGFRIDVAQGLVKNMLMPDNPQLRPITADMTPRQAFACFDHRYDLDQVGNTEIYRRWRSIVEPKDALLLGEVYLRDNNPAKVNRYVATQDGLHRAFYFAPMHTPWEPSAMWATFSNALNAAPRDLSWAISSHDDSRARSRFQSEQFEHIGQQRALAYAVFLCALPGLPFLYQGDELGLADVEIPFELMRDPVAVRNQNSGDGRDGSRTPMPWEPGPLGGFTTNAETWLPVGRCDADTVAVQKDDPFSPLGKHKELLAVRRELSDLHTEELQWYTSTGDLVISFRRGACICALNMADEATDFILPAGQWRLAYSSARAAGEIAESSISLTAPEGVLLVKSA